MNNNEESNEFLDIEKKNEKNSYIIIVVILYVMVIILVVLFILGVHKQKETIQNTRTAFINNYDMAQENL